MRSELCEQASHEREARGLKDSDAVSRFGAKTSDMFSYITEAP